MATISEARRRPEPGSGGKIVRSWRALLPKTPYDRPTMLNSTLQNHNWISRHIVSPTRTIVSTATKVLSSVLGFESSSSSSSSSSYCNSNSGSVPFYVIFFLVKCLYYSKSSIIPIAMALVLVVIMECFTFAIQLFY